MVNNKNNKLISLIIVLCVVLCGIVALIIYYDGNGSHKYNRTIMIYMVGADLESGIGLATEDLEGLDYQTLEKQKTKVVAIVGGSKKWHNNYIDVSSTSIYELTDQGYQMVKEQDKQSMGSTTALTNFLNYAYENYDSNKYALVFWNHGLGVLGSESDELAEDYLSLSEINTSLATSPFGGNKKLEFILFRTCLNGMLEVADTIKNYANYMIASEEITLGYRGNSTLKAFNNVKSSDNPKVIGKKFVDNYMDYINSLETLSASEFYKTYSVIDLSKINKLEEAVNNFFKDIDLSKNYNQIARVRSTIKQYGQPESSPVYDSVDLYSLVFSLQSLSPNNAKKVLNSFDDAVVYNVSSNSESNGLSIYFPFNGRQSDRKVILDRFYSFNNLSGYKKFINDFYTVQTTGKSALNFSSNTVNLNVVSEKKESDFTMELTEEQKENFAKAEYIVFKGKENGYYVPLYRGRNAFLEGNTLKANIKDRQLVITDKNGDSDVLLLIENEETNDYIKYSSNVILENLDTWQFDQALLTLKLDKKTNKVSVVSLLKSQQEVESEEFAAKTPYNIPVNLKDYTHIAFTHGNYKILDENGNYNSNWEWDKSVHGLEAPVDGLNFSVYDYSDDFDYYAVFVIVDTKNNSYYSNLVKMK